MAVDRADADARSRRNLAYWGIDARLCKHIHGRLQQRAQVALGVDTSGAWLLGVRPGFRLFLVWLRIHKNIY
jgi:hypothetical protein